MPTESVTLTNRTEVEAWYDVADGVITSPGKFQSEPWYAPIVYQWVMDGDGERIGNASIFPLDDTDRELFELASTDTYIALSVSEQGFVYVTTLDQSELETLSEDELGDELGDE